MKKLNIRLGRAAIVSEWAEHEVGDRTTTVRWTSGDDNFDYVLNYTSH